MCILAFVKSKYILGFKEVFLSGLVECKSETKENEELEQRNKCINLCFHVNFPVNQSSLLQKAGFVFKN